MKLAFDKFDIESTVDSENSFPICDDSLEVRFTLPGHPGVNYRERRFSSVIISEVNYIVLTLSSWLTGTGNGFTASVSLITESCYDLLDDCAMLVAEEPTFCQNNVEAQRICRQSCGFCMMGKPKPGI
ncbi:Hypothetical predicted protein [Mytilus galloprovincialis]|uniref:ShKT domain-containing protein n=1 Tax=Mytilus galloprovincialis TaxID=29158 RepID=A0A8B6C7Y8_MYTGA|nr:Hypothetical predicted protein [Mytilus galloprovincialis]